MYKWHILTKRRKSSLIKNNKEIINLLLSNRGYKNKKNIQDFLSPSLNKISCKNLDINKSQLHRIIKRIKKAIIDKESIVVYTDYDTDGICSGAIVWEILNELGAKVMPYVPHRIKEGYGLSKKGIDFIKKEFAVDLIITVDHGISAAPKINYAKNLGIEVIVVDHHIKPDKKIKNLNLLHTTKLCATGLAWFLAYNLLKELSGKVKKKDAEINISRNLDLVALATVSDMVPLTDANRILVYHGLKQFSKTKRIGLKILIEYLGLDKNKIGVYELGHIISPRINALGRLTHAIDALRLICTTNETRAVNLIKQINIINQQRQVQTQNSTLHAIDNVIKDMKKSEKHEKEDKLIIVCHKSYQQGIIGLIASRLVDEFNKPAIVIAEGEKISKASARSVKGLNIIAALREVDDLLIDVGGHPMAAGFTIETKNINLLKDKLQSIVEHKIDLNRDKILNIDLELKPEEINIDLFNEIMRLSPFGIGNPEPIFISKNMKVLGSQLVGKNKNHLKLRIKGKSNHGHTYDALGFDMGNFFYKFSAGSSIDIAYRIENNYWNGNYNLQFHLKDVRITECTSDN